MARIYEKARIGDIDIHYHLADYTDPWRKTPAELGEWWARDMDRTPRHVAAAVFRCFSTADL
jgi:hypothetical protein